MKTPGCPYGPGFLMKLKDLINQLEELDIDPRTSEEEIGVETPRGAEFEIDRVEVNRNVNPHIRLVCKP